MQRCNEMVSVKGRVLIYSTNDCVSCVKAKQKLTELRVPFTEVMLDSFPSLREEVKRRTGRNTVPQIFFNEYHVGGYDDLEKLIEEDKTQFQKLLFMIQNEEVPFDAPRPPDPRTSVDNYFSSLSVFDTDELMPIIFALKDMKVFKNNKMGLLKKYKDTLYGQDLIDWLRDEKDIFDTESAYIVGQKLIDRHLFHDVNHNIDEKFTSNRYYKFLENEYSHALNAGDISPNVPLKVSKFNELFQLKFTNFFNCRGSFNNFQDEHFKAKMLINESLECFLQTTKELQRLNFVGCTLAERLALFLNVYNALLIHGRLMVDTSCTTRFKMCKFYHKCSYIIGGYCYSLNEIKHGILRCNRKAPRALKRPFSKADPRIKISLSESDPRIHFALHDNSTILLPIKYFTSKNVKSELKEIAHRFLENEEAVNVVGNSLKLHKLFKRYAKDFGKNQSEVLSFILNNFDESSKKRAQFETVIQSNSLSVSYIKSGN